MSNIIGSVKKMAKQYHSDVVKIRRHLHAHPELSFQEEKTAKYIADQLDTIGISYTTGWAKNGVVGVIKGKLKSDKVIALRADIDALPIDEENDVSYKSKNKGIMHACGHDVHTASLLGAAQILNELISDFGGTIKLIFQPAEEKLPGGAKQMIKEGVLQNPNTQSILAQHVHPPLEAGKVGIKAGNYMASADEIYLTINGKGGHGALPQNIIDPVLISSHVLIALQNVISRHCPPGVPSVLSFGNIQSIGGTTNVIPNMVKIEGTFRAMDEKWRNQAHEYIKKIAIKTAEAHGGSCDVKIVIGYPSLANTVELTKKVESNMIDYLGKDNVVNLPIRLTAEDFSYYGYKIDSCFYRLGTANKSKGITSQVHTSTFDIDEESLEVGSGLMAYLAICQLIEN